MSEGQATVPSGKAAAPTQDLESRVKQLEELLMPFAKIPFDPGKRQDEVLYRLTLPMGSAEIKSGHIVRARKALGMV